MYESGQLDGDESEFRKFNEDVLITMTDDSPISPFPNTILMSQAEFRRNLASLDITRLVEHYTEPFFVLTIHYASILVGSRIIARSHNPNYIRIPDKSDDSRHEGEYDDVSS